MTTQKPQMQFFKIENFEITPLPSAKIDMPGFHFKKAADTITTGSMWGSKDFVSEQIANACQGLTVHSNLDALKELCTICNHYDSKDKIRWDNSLLHIRERLSFLHFDSKFTTEFIEKVKKIVLPEEVKV